MLIVKCRVWSVKYTVWSVNCAVSSAVKENEQQGGNGREIAFETRAVYSVE